MYIYIYMSESAGRDGFGEMTRVVMKLKFGCTFWYNPQPKFQLKIDLLAVRRFLLCCIADSSSTLFDTLSKCTSRNLPLSCQLQSSHVQCSWSRARGRHESKLPVSAEAQSRGDLRDLYVS